MPPSRRKGPSTEHFCGLECYQRFQARASTATETSVKPDALIRRRQVEAYPNLMSDAM